jgi:hypothetical protein
VTLALEVDGAHRPDRPVSAASAHREEEADLILPNGSKIHYVRISPSGLPCYQTVFEHTTTPTAFYKSRIAWNGNGWDLTLVDGTVYVFGHAAPPPPCRCSTATHSIA